MDSPKFNREKFEAVVLYILRKCGGFANFGKTNLFKMLYFSDFDYYERYETHLTGESYARLARGPAPRHFRDVIKSMQNEGKVSLCKARYHNLPQQKFEANIEPDLALLDGNELETINNVIEKYQSMNATQISEHSHQDLPYKATEEGKTIDYELVFYRDPLFSVREYK